jgi:phytoene dehydrogenase-like protein
VRRYVFPDGNRLDLPNVSRGGLRSAFDGALGPGAGEHWLRAIDHGGRAWDAIRPTLVEAPRGGRRELARLLRSRSGRGALTPGRSLRALSRSWFADPRLSLLLDDYARQAGADPAEAPGVLAVRIYIEHVFGTWQVWGGLYQLADALYERVLGLGVQVRLDTAVVRIDSVGGGVTGVVLPDGERLSAEVVVAAVDKAALAEMSGASAPKVAYPPPVTTLCLALDDASAPLPMPHETVLLSEHDAAVRIHVPADRPRAWTVHAEGAWESEDLLKVLAGHGFELRGRILAQHLVSTAGTAPFGPSMRDLSSALLRSPIAQPTRGLFHVGASARPGAGVSFAAQSALLAAELIGSA